MANNSPIFYNDIKSGNIELFKHRNDSMTCTQAAVINPKHYFLNEAEDKTFSKEDQ